MCHDSGMCNVYIFQVAVGDKDGVVQLFSFKKNDLQVIFKTLPGKAITNMELGGALGQCYMQKVVLILFIIFKYCLII